MKKMRKNMIHQTLREQYPHNAKFKKGITARVSKKIPRMPIAK